MPKPTAHLHRLLLNQGKIRKILGFRVVASTSNLLVLYHLKTPIPLKEVKKSQRVLTPVM
jgi:hypothetical protein